MAIRHQLPDSAYPIKIHLELNLFKINGSFQRLTCLKKSLAHAFLSEETETFFRIVYFHKQAR